MNKEQVDDCTIFLTTTGSVAYGTNTPTSDEDFRGIAIPKDKGYYFGFIKHFEQFEDPQKDFVVYDIRKAFNLISDCNPNMIDLLFTDERFFKKITPYWQKVIDNRDKFLSKRARYTYTGYAFAQLKRIKVARNYLLNPPKKKPERSDYGLPDKSLLSKDDLGAFQWVMAYMLQDTIQYLSFSEATKKELEEANWIGMVQQKGIPERAFDEVQSITGASDTWMEVMRREQAYLNAKRAWDSYVGWKNNRNKARSVLEEKHGYDTKHAAHLVRLMRMGKEILSEGKVQVFRPDREELLAIRNGAWTYEQIEEYAETMEKEIALLSETSKLPKEPNRNQLDDMCMSIIDEYLSAELHNR